MLEGGSPAASIRWLNIVKLLTVAPTEIKAVVSDTPTRKPLLRNPTAPTSLGTSTGTDRIAPTAHNENSFSRIILASVGNQSSSTTWTKKAPAAIIPSIADGSRVMTARTGQHPLQSSTDSAAHQQQEDGLVEHTRFMEQQEQQMDVPARTNVHTHPSSPPVLSASTISSLSEDLHTYYRDHCLSPSDHRVRSEALASLQSIVQRVDQNLRLEVFGSAASRTAMKGSDMGTAATESTQYTHACNVELQRATLYLLGMCQLNCIFVCLCSLSVLCCVLCRRVYGEFDRQASDCLLV